MTNAEKFLKDGTREEFIKQINEELDYAGGQFNIESFLNAQIKPTLTEDERVILRNIDIDNYKGIGRENGTLYLVSATPNFFGGENDKEVFWYCFHELFQFIKERRRILNSRIIRR